MGLSHNKSVKQLTVLFAGLLGIFSLVAQPDAPTGLTAVGYDHHVELNWEQNAEPNLQGYNVYVSTDGSNFSFVRYVQAPQTRFVHFIGEWDATRHYRVTAQGGGQESAPSAVVQGATFQMTDDELLDMVQAYTFRYFWEHGHPASGMARERNNANVVTSGGSGFGIMALLVGIERGFITYEEGLLRMRKIVDFLQIAPRFRGAYAHWMNGNTGQVAPFSALDDGGDLVETAFLMQGLLTARQYFSASGEQETRLRDDITALWEGVDWNWYRKLVDNVLYWHWSPNHNFAINLALRGFNETHIVYLLAVASPVEAHNIPPQLYHTGWAGGNYTTGASYYGYPLGVGGFRGGPLFFSHYSYLGFDPRNRRDAYANYFVRNTYHTLINRAHCIANPFNRVGYSADNWGLTASDDPFVGYLAHEPGNNQLDNGTIAPTAALSSMPYTPEFSMQALKYFYREQGARLWGPYGFYDAFNLGANWFANSYLAIDQGPIICMIENHRTGLLWDLFMQNPEITPALEAVGFVPDSAVVNNTRTVSGAEFDVALSPNPARDWVKASFELQRPARVRLSLLDANGRLVALLQDEVQLPSGRHEWEAALPSSLPPGVYGALFESDGSIWVEPLYIH